MKSQRMRNLLAMLVLAQCTNVIAKVTLELTDNMKLPDAYANNQVLHLPLACCPSIRRLNRSAPIDAACTPMLGGRRLHVIVG